MRLDVLRTLLTPFLLGSALLLGGCAAPPPPAGDPEAYMPELAAYLPGVWQVDELPARLPWFLCASSNDEVFAAFNPPGYHPLDMQAESLRLVVLPCQGSAWDQAGHVLVRVTVDGETREFVRPYEVHGNAGGEVQIRIETTSYLLRVGPRPGELELVPLPGMNGKNEPTLKLRWLIGLPGTYRSTTPTLPPGVAVAGGAS